MEFRVFLFLLALASALTPEDMRKWELDPESGGIIVTQYNLDNLIDHVKSKNGTLFLFITKDPCGPCL